MPYSILTIQKLAQMIISINNVKPLSYTCPHFEVMTENNTSNENNKCDQSLLSKSRSELLTPLIVIHEIKSPVNNLPGNLPDSNNKRYFDTHIFNNIIDEGKFNQITKMPTLTDNHGKIKGIFWIKWFCVP